MVTERCRDYSRRGRPAGRGLFRWSFVLSAIMSLLLVACAPAAPPPAAAPAKPAESKPAEAAKPAAQATTAPSAPKPVGKAGGNLRIALAAKPTSLDPNVWTGTSDAFIMRQIFDPLIWQPEPGKLVPGLAESWEVSPDGKVYTFKLRKDVKFHDGTPLTAESLKFTYDRMIDPATKSLQTPQLGLYERTEVVDQHTARVTLKEPFAPFLSNMTDLALVPASAEAVSKLGNDYNQKPVGTGPFRFKEWVDANTFVLERNPDYNWAPPFMGRQGPALIETITYRAVPDQSGRTVALETNEVDLITIPDYAEIGRLKQDQKYTVWEPPAAGLPLILPFNLENPITGDLKVRQAILHAVDRSRINELVFYNTYRTGTGALAKGTLAYSDATESMYPYDLAKAKALLDEAGWKPGPDGIRVKDGQPLRLRHVTIASYNNVKPGELVQAMVREIGIDGQLEGMPYDAAVKRWTEGSYELAQFNYTGTDPHIPFFLTFHSSQITGGGQFNRNKLKDPEIDRLIEEGMRGTDQAKRPEVYRQLQKLVMDQALFIPIFDQMFHNVSTSRLTGLQFDLVARPWFYTASLD